jgi:Glycosyl hydrolase family 26
MSTRAGRAAATALVVALFPVLGGVGASLYMFKREAVLPAAVAAAPVAAPVSKTYLGAITPNVGSFAKAVGQKPNLAVRYFNWGAKPPASFVEQSASAGAMSLLELEPRSIKLKDIIAGRGDGYLKRVGRALAATHSQVMLSFAPEMDGRWYSWGFTHRSARVFRRAWRHVYREVTKVPGTKIIWVWQISHKFPRAEALHPLWPGGKYVSMIGIDGYYEHRYNTFHSIFGSTIKILRRFTAKPIMITETAVGQVAGKAAKIPGLFDGMRRFGVRGINWFDINQNGGIHHQRWRLEGHPAAVAAFIKGLQAWEQAEK